jgi:hypothetical protein
VVATIKALTGGLGADVAIEAVGVPATFELCTQVIRPGGRVANVGVHGAPVTLHLEDLWIKNVTITTGLVDTRTTPRLLAMLAAGRLAMPGLITHRFGLDEMQDAYDVFSRAGETGAPAERLGDLAERHRQPVIHVGRSQHSPPYSGRLRCESAVLDQCGTHDLSLLQYGQRTGNERRTSVDCPVRSGPWSLPLTARIADAEGTGEPADSPDPVNTEVAEATRSTVIKTVNRTPRAGGPLPTARCRPT